MSRDTHRARIRRLALGALLVGIGLVGLAGGEVLETQAYERFGPGDVDEALDANGIELEATIMSSDAWEGSWLVSYEYYFGPTLEVGYQRVDASLGRNLAFGHRVPIDAIEEPLEGARFPASSRLQGTVREPHAGLTRGIQSLRGPRRALGGLVTLTGVAALVLSARRGSP